LAIGAYDESGNITQFSGTGPQVDFAGPGQKVYTTWLNHGYKDVRGTSFAAPFVCGIIALMISKHLKQEKLTGKNDCKTPYQVKQHLVKYSKDAGQSGKDSNFGYGIIDVSKIHEDPTSLPEVPAKEPPKRKKWWKQLLGI
jgi:subtilisin family serine protease